MTRALGLFFVAMCLLCGLGTAVRAQTPLQASAIALTPGAFEYYFDNNRLEVQIEDVTCTGCATGENLYMWPTGSSADPELIIEAASLNESNDNYYLDPIFNYPSVNACSSGCDLNVLLNVQVNASKSPGLKVYDISQSLDASAAPSSVYSSNPTAVNVSESVYLPSNPVPTLCGLATDLQHMNAVCPTFSGLTDFNVDKDLQLIPVGGSTLELISLEQVFTPEPGSMAILVGGLAALGAMRLRRTGPVI